MILSHIRSFLAAALIGLGALGAVVTIPATATAADDAAAELGRALLLDDLFKVMGREGEAYGADLDRDFLGGQGGSGWSEAVAGIYDPVRIGQDFDRAFTAELTQSGADIGAMTAFFTSDLGQRIMVLELSAREALLDDEIEQGARAAYGRMQADADPRVDLVRRYVETNHLIDLNVAGALNANVAFLSAMGQAAGAKQPLAEGEILAQVWAQEDEVRAETEEWVMSYAIMAYAPLTDAELQSYIDFSATEDGAALNRALFAAFDRLFLSVSGDLGRALGQTLTGTRL